jgi:tetratricopeptide (TPR) repeat protein
LSVTAGVLREPVLEDDRVILWLPGEREGEYQYWERVGNVARAEVTVERGVCATAATAVRARQRVRGVLGRLFSRGPAATGGRVWVLPNGGTAEACGERRTDVVLAWAEDADGLDETRIKARWPESQGLREIGENLFLVSGVGVRRAGREPAATPAAPAAEPIPPGNPRPQAEKRLDAARRSGDPRAEAMALADLGVVCIIEGRAERGFPLLNEALQIARRTGDKARECDVLGNLGEAVLSAGDPGRAREIFEQEFAVARDAGDLFAEKLALEHLGTASSELRDHDRALELFDRALRLARQVGDRQREPVLLWHQGIQHAELGQRDRAIAKAQEAVDLLATAGKPQATVYSEHLQKFRASESGSGLGPILGSSVVVQGGASPVTVETTGGPGLLRMALTAASSMTRFLLGGMRTVNDAVYEKRMRTCAACEHHTGLRCRICGCFTHVKTRMPEEECPILKWPA